MQEIKGLSTGIGSLPHTDVDAALDLVFKYVPLIPFWPQLPKLNVREGMVAQFSENLPFMSMNENGLTFSTLESEDKDRDLESFYEHIIANDLDYFQISESYASGLHKFYTRLKTQDLKDVCFIKCQITGPFTFAASLTDNKGIPLLHDTIIKQAILRGLALKANWQIRLFRKFGKKIILFIDEPYLGCFGSAFTPINREDVIRGLTEFTETLKSDDVLLGVHCCGNTDWSIFMDVVGLDIISFDAFDFIDRLILYADNLKTFFNRQGILCWGIVPTQLFTGLETAELLIRKLKEGVNALVRKGLDESLLFKSLLISPSCGLGTFTPEKSEKVFSLLSEVSSLIRKYY
jgi:methionine synthase II (cobalamin-independent)